MNKIISFLKKKWFVQSVGLGAFLALIWFGGPFIGIAGIHPFSPKINRLLAILVAVSGWAIYRLVVSSRANEREGIFIKTMANQQADSESEEIDKRQKEESETLKLKLEDALGKLKESKAKSRWDKQYLYDLPWYMIIGAPGCGKTTLLANSGLRLLSSEYEDIDDIKGVGGTRNCDWLFSDEAIFLDTAGRYATQDSHRSVDEAAWRRFLELLKNYRSRRPINGVLVTVSVSDLLQKNEGERRGHAKEIRRRVEELKQSLGVRFPVYMLFSKCDLIAGFNEFFADLTPEQREQVWGVTFPEPDEERTNKYLDDFEKDFDDLLSRLDNWTLSRIQQTQNKQGRSLILDFPRQMASVKPAVTTFIKETFVKDTFGNEFNKSFLLRGVYFTSGTQEGTPIDRILGILAKTYGLNEQEAPVYSGRGKSFFLSRLLKEVIFPEAELAGTDPKIERRRKIRGYLACSAVLMVAFLVCTAWLVSYTNTKRRIAEVKRIVENYPESSPEGDWGKAVRKLHNRLRELRNARKVYLQPSTFAGFGLDQSGKVTSLIEDTYHETMEKELLPVVKDRLEKEIQLRISGRESDDFYNLLKVYLLLDRSPEERIEYLDFAVGILGRLWDQENYLYRIAGEQFRDEYRMQFRDLFSLTFNAKSFVPNLNLVRNARNKLNEKPLYIRIYEQLKGNFLSDNNYEFRLKEVLGPFGKSVFVLKDRSELERFKISGLYTCEGYHEIFERQGYSFVEEALAENWVVENPVAGRVEDFNPIFDNLQRAYFSDYLRKWEYLRNNIAVQRPTRDNLENLLVYLTHSEGPLRPLVEAICKNTSLVTNSSCLSPSDLAKSQQSGGNSLNSSILKEPNEYLLNIEKEFESFCALSTGINPSQPTLGEVSQLLKRLQGTLGKIRSTNQGCNDGVNIELDDMERELKSLPSPIDKWFSPLVQRTKLICAKDRREILERIWKSEVVRPFQQTLANRYPFARGSSRGVKITDFSRFFAPGGILDQFFKEEIQSYVDTTTSPWQEIPIGGQKMDISRNFLAQFENAEKIRNSFFGLGSPIPSVSFDLKPIEMDPNAGEFILNIAGQTTLYQHGPRQTVSFQWPGPQPGIGVRLNFKNLQGRQAGSPLSVPGDWALFRVLDRSGLSGSNETGRFSVKFQVNGFWARYELIAHSAYNPFRLAALSQFHCPEKL